MKEIKNQEAYSTFIQSLDSQQLKWYKKAHGIVPEYMTDEETVDYLIEKCPELVDEKISTLLARLSDLVKLGAVQKNGRNEYIKTSVDEFITKGAIVEVTRTFLVAKWQKLDRTDATVTQVVAATTTILRSAGGS